MNKKQIILIIVLTTVIVWLADLLVGNYLSARLATAPWAQKFNLFNPQAPIVVTNRETIRVNNSNDTIETAENAKAKLSTLVYIENGRIVPTGNLVNWTSDGYFLTAKSSFEAQNKVYAVITYSGDIYPVQKTVTDPASNIVIVETAAQGLVVLDPADTSDLRVGQQLVSILNSVGNKQTQFSTAYVQKLSSDNSGEMVESDLVARNIELQQPVGLPAGSGMINLSGRLVGIWDGVQIVPVEELRLLVNNFLSNNKTVVRPSYGFAYQILSEQEAKALQTTAGAKVIAVTPSSPAALVGLKVSDVITEVGERKVDTELNLDNLLRQLKIGENLKLTVDRAGQILEINLVATQLK